MKRNIAFIVILMFIGIMLFRIYDSVSVSSDDTQDSVVASSIRTILLDELKVKIFGGYINDSHIKEAINSLSNTQRLEFIRIFIQRSSLLEESGELATILDMDIIASNKANLLSYLNEFKHTPRFAQLPINQQKRLDAWVEMLKARS